MYSEIHAAVQFLNHFLYNKLPRRKVDLFAQQLANDLLLRCSSIWNPGNPRDGSEMRRISVKFHGTVDTLISVTALHVGLNLDEVLQQFPDELIIWVDPGQVAYQIGEHGPTSVIYSASEANNSLLNRLLTQSSGLSPEGTGLRLSLPGVNNPTPGWCPRSAVQYQQVVQEGNPRAPTFELTSPNDVQFTVGSFAMTRFGTTKVKNVPTALNRLRQKHRARTSDAHFRPIVSVSQSATNTPPPVTGGFGSTRPFSAVPFYSTSLGFAQQAATHSLSSNLTSITNSTIQNVFGNNSLFGGGRWSPVSSYSASSSLFEPLTFNEYNSMNGGIVTTPFKNTGGGTSMGAGDASSPNSSSSISFGGNDRRIITAEASTSVTSTLTPLSTSSFSGDQRSGGEDNLATSLFGLPPIGQPSVWEGTF